MSLNVTDSKQWTLFLIYRYNLKYIQIHWVNPDNPQKSNSFNVLEIKIFNADLWRSHEISGRFMICTLFFKYKS